MALFLFLLLLLGVLCLGAYAIFPRVRAIALPVHLGWFGLFLIFLADLIRAWPKS
jgi:hypothetical protein